MSSNAWMVVLAVSPLLLVLYLMIGRKWGGSKAGIAGWLTAVAISLIFFGAKIPLLLVAAGKAFLLAFFVLYIIWMALLLYHVINDAGAIAVIGEQLPRLTHGKGAQALLLSWVFGSFLQGASGFGVPAAVVAPLLVGLGFGVNAAVVIALIGHAWAITFGSLGSSYFSLIAASGISGDLLASPTAIYLTLACVCCGVIVLWVTGQWSALKRRGILMLMLALLMSGTQWLLARLGLWSLAAFGAGLVGLIAAVLYFRYEVTHISNATDNSPTFKMQNLTNAIFPYVIMTIIILLGQLVFDRTLAVFTLNFDFPAVETSLGWATAAGRGRSINLLGHPGALLFYASVAAYGWYYWRGTMGEAAVLPYRWQTIFSKTVKGSWKSTVSILALVAMATTMEHAGMTQQIAEALSSTGQFFPILSPFIGGLGSFMTGSNTNSNVVFAELQRQTAVALNLSVPIILAAQTAGGALGSVFAPAKVIVGCSTVPGADDGSVLKMATIYGLLSIIAISLLSWLTT